MAPLKEPGSDGYQAFFFQSQWDSIGGEICKWYSLKNFPKSRLDSSLLQRSSTQCEGKIKKWMAIKIDLEKAYDRVRWDFIEKSIQAVEIPNYLRKVIMSAISTVAMQVLWNGVPTKKFRPAKGVKQSFPLSPYLFVLCMEWIRHCIQTTITIGEWSSIKMSRTGPALSHLFFVDDLVIFSKAYIKRDLLLKHNLTQFCSILGHCVNARKTNMSFQKGWMRT
ncbi:Retrovirus-related Pol polyprotein LINE-1 [Gossypium australe]|uniref:Retrovirus-related Pol polyprotein LINE-1 n=1 Tax=Gossypium australe TaxID=47621 RepID=A0A5B6W526_9ROSI|nr:Retrovirus-related Pol polyprotein LINE-1 [Gossypium australe]